MKTITALGVTGGAGASTIAAHLAAALAMQGRQSLALDCSPDNHLRLYFGMTLHAADGWALECLRGEPLAGAGHVSAAGVEFVPFGRLDGDAALERLSMRLRSQPEWLRQQLDMLRGAADALVVCDCPRLPAALREQALAAADLVLLVCAPDSVSYAIAADMLARADEPGAPPMYIVLNGFDASRRLDRDIAVILRSQHGDHFAPVAIHRDESVREALACKQTVFDFAPSSQAAYDFSALATWVLARFGQLSEAA